MRTKIVTILVLAFFFSTNAQDKKWTLQECVDYAVENNISIKQQELSKELIEEDIITAKGNFYPSLNASASQNFNFGSYINSNVESDIYDTVSADVSIVDRSIKDIKTIRFRIISIGTVKAFGLNDMSLYFRIKGIY